MSGGQRLAVAEAPHLRLSAAQDLVRFMGEEPQGPEPGTCLEAHVSDEGKIILVFANKMMRSHVVLDGSGKAYYLEESA